jgi:hypothetical protein
MFALGGMALKPFLYCWGEVCRRIWDNTGIIIERKSITLGDRKERVAKPVACDA